MRRISFACLSPPAFPVQSSSPADKRTPKRRFGAIRHVMNVKNKTCLFCLKQRQILVDDSCTAKAIQKIYSITVRKNKSISQTSAQIRSRVDTGRILECVFTFSEKSNSAVKMASAKLSFLVERTWTCAKFQGYARIASAKQKWECWTQSKMQTIYFVLYLSLSQ